MKGKGKQKEEGGAKERLQTGLEGIKWARAGKRKVREEGSKFDMLK